jgi:hypothetical protein
MANSSLAANTRFGGAVSPSGLVIPATGYADVNSNLIRTSDAGDGTSYLGGSLTLMTLPSAAYTTSVPASCTFSTTWVTYSTLDMTITSFTGGTAPAIAFFLERQGADGVWYPLCSTGNINTTGLVSVDISPNLNGTFSGPIGSTYQHGVFTHSGRFRWTFGGSVAPSAVTFSASIVGR